MPSPFTNFDFPYYMFIYNSENIHYRLGCLIDRENNNSKHFIITCAQLKQEFKDLYHNITRKRITC